MQKATYYVVPFIFNAQFIAQYISGCQKLGEKEWESLLMSFRLFSKVIKKNVPELGSDG